MSMRALRFTVLALQRQVARELTAALAPLDLTPSQAEVVTVVGEYGPLSVREVGDYLICESGSPSRLVQSLVTRRLLARAVSASDRRTSFLTLTPEGREAMKRIIEIETEYEVALSMRLDRAIQGGSAVSAGAGKRGASSSGPGGGAGPGVGVVEAVSGVLREGVTDELLAGALIRRFPVTAQGGASDGSHSTSMSGGESAARGSRGASSTSADSSTLFPA